MSEEQEVEAYDSRPDTQAHIEQVRFRLTWVILDLARRSLRHDASKLLSPEVEVFDVVTPKLKSLVYGSDEYKACLAEMGDALVHHYAVNDHHPEHFGGGIGAMGMVELIEMLADWKAATSRTADGDLRKSIELNAGRFGYGPEFQKMLLNTASYLDWL